MTRQPPTEVHAPVTPGAPCRVEPADHHLGAVISLDVPRDDVHVDIAGSLTRVTRSQLLCIAERIRALRAGSHIHVHLGRAAFVGSAAFAGLRSDLDAIAHRPAGKPGQGRGVSLEAQSRDSARTPQRARSGIGSRPVFLDGHTSGDLLTASDFVYGWLDDEQGCPGTNVAAMVELYELIGQAIARRIG